MDPTDPTLSRRGLVAVSMAAVALGAAASEAQAAGTVTVPDYIVERLHGLGVRHLFGVPGATCDPLFEAAQAGPLDVVVTSSDLDAGSHDSSRRVALLRMHGTRRRCRASWCSARGLSMIRYYFGRRPRPRARSLHSQATLAT